MKNLKIRFHMLNEQFEEPEKYSRNMVLAATRTVLKQLKVH